MVNLDAAALEETRPTPRTAFEALAEISLLLGALSPSSRLHVALRALDAARDAAHDPEANALAPDLARSDTFRASLGDEVNQSSPKLDSPVRPFTSPSSRGGASTSIGGMDVGGSSSSSSCSSGSLSVSGSTIGSDGAPVGAEASPLSSPTRGGTSPLSSPLASPSLRRPSPFSSPSPPRRGGASSPLPTPSHRSPLPHPSPARQPSAAAAPLFEHLFVAGLPDDTPPAALLAACRAPPGGHRPPAVSPTPQVHSSPGRWLLRARPKPPPSPAGPLAARVLRAFPGPAAAAAAALPPADSLCDFCFPGGVRPRLLSAAGSMTAANGVLFGHSHTVRRRDGNAFVFTTTDANGRQLFGACVLSSVLVRVAAAAAAPPPSTAGAALRRATLAKKKKTAPAKELVDVELPRCHCLLSRASCFGLHFAILLDIVAADRLAALRGGRASTFDALSRVCDTLCALNFPPLPGRELVFAVSEDLPEIRYRAPPPPASPARRQRHRPGVGSAAACFPASPGSRQRRRQAPRTPTTTWSPRGGASSTLPSRRAEPRAGSTALFRTWRPRPQPLPQRRPRPGAGARGGGAAGRGGTPER